MPRRTQLYQQVPWTGGVNTSLDAGVLPPNDLVQADNISFSASGARIKREGFDFFDTALPAVVSRSSSGTTRTLIFASTISDVVPPVDHLIVVGEKLTIAASTDANYNSTACIVASVSGTTMTYTFDGAGSLTEGTTAASSITVARNYDIIAVFDHWYFVSSNAGKAQVLVAITSQGLMFRYDANGLRKQIAISGSGATALAVTTLTSADLRTYNNKLIWTMSGLANTPKYVDFATADEWKDLATNAPDASIMQEHQGRLWMNDKTNLDRLHYCETFDETLWLGIGDSGAIDIAQGDGDENGLTAIYPTFKGRMIIGKGSKTFQMTGEAPEEYFVEAMSSGLGAISHKSVVAVDLDDIFYFSQRGAHSIKATDQYGDFAGGYISKDIQPTYNLWSNGQRKFTQGAFISTLNSVAWTVAENGQTKPNALWLFNPYVKNAQEDAGVWYRWPDLNPQSVCMQVYSSKPRIVIGNNAGRILRGQNAQYTDRGTYGITFRAKTGTIYVDNSPQSIKAFKKFGLLFRPKGRYSFTAYFKVDAQPVQTILFEQAQTGATLGTTFTLGASILGNSAILAPYMKDVIGHGRGCTIEIFQTGTEAQIEVYGFLIEYESADIADEVIQDG